MSIANRHVISATKQGLERCQLCGSAQGDRLQAKAKPSPATGFAAAADTAQARLIAPSPFQFDAAAGGR